MVLHDIPRIPYLTPDRLALYLRSPQCPLILTGVMEAWDTAHWSFGYFGQEFADFPVTAHAPQFPSLAICSVKMLVRDYTSYLENPDPANVRGTWVRGTPELLAESGLTLYAGNFNPAHPRHGNAKKIFAAVPREPVFIESWLDLVEPRFLEWCMAAQSHHFVYLSIPGGVTPLHQDFWSTHAFLAQVRGRKRATLFAPTCARDLYSDATGDVRLIAEKPEFAHVEGWVGDLQEGECLIIPSMWLHHVETLEPSITYSADWIDGTNWSCYVEEAKSEMSRRGAHAG